MKHLDEGTIHAWLDGALDAVQALEIEAHVAQCTTCSALVAEARGLVAASSRILTALDDVPGGVVPKRFAPPVKRARFQWRAAPWVSAIAATLILAVGIMRVNRKDQLGPFDKAVADSAQAATQPVGRVLSVPPAAAPAAEVAARESAPELRMRSAVVSRQDLQVDSARSAPTALADRAADALASSAGGAGAPGQEARRELAAGAPAALAPAAPTALAEPLEQKLEKTAKAAAPRAQVPRAALDEAVVTGARDAGKKSDDDLAVGRLAGCYRLPTAQPGVVQKAAEGVARVAAEARDARRTAAANFAAPAVPDLVRLDTAAGPRGLRRVAAGFDSLVGGWSRVGPDTADVRLVSGVAFKLTSKNRVSCPER